MSRDMVARQFEPVILGNKVEPSEVPNKEPKEPTIIIETAARLKPRPIEWAWYGFLAKGNLHILAGSPGTGKTTLAIDMAARLTTGGEWPDGTQAAQGDVLMWSAEDDLEPVLLPRFIAANADTSRVHFVTGTADKDGKKHPFDFSQDLKGLAAEASKLPPLSLIIIDPVVCAVQGDGHKNGDVRRGLQPLVELARDLNCAVLGITHFSKGTQGKDPVERVTGSLAYGAVARIVLATAKPNDPRGELCLIRSKSNIGKQDDGFRYKLEQMFIDDGADNLIETQRIVWGSAVTGLAKSLLDEIEVQEDADARSAVDEASEFLQCELQAGPISAKEIERRAKDAGVSISTLRRARNRLEIKSRKSAMDGGWVWELRYAQVEDAHAAAEDAHL